MLFAQILIAILLVAIAPVSRADGGAHIRLLPRADIGKAFFALGDIADIESGNSQLQQRLAALRIGQSPRTGYRLSLARAAVEEAVARELPSLRGALRWGGAQRVDVHAGGQRVSAKHIVDTAASAAVEALRPAYQGLDLKPVSQLDDVSVPQGAVAFAARLDPSKSVTKRLCVPVEVTVDGQVYRTVYVWFSVRAMQKVWVAQRSQAAGQPLQEAGFRSELRDVTSLSSAPVSVHDQPLRTLRLRRPIEAGGAVARHASGGAARGGAQRPSRREAHQRGDCDRDEWRRAR